MQILIYDLSLVECTSIHVTDTMIGPNAAEAKQIRKKTASRDVDRGIFSADTPTPFRV